MWEIVPLSMDGQILLLYSIFYRRNKVAAAARVAWPGNVIPTFRNNKENMKKLDELVVELETEYSLPYFAGGLSTTLLSHEALPQDAHKKYTLYTTHEYVRDLSHSLLPLFRYLT